MKFKIVSDSSSNVREFADIPFESVPLKIITEEKEYVDDANLDVPAMVEDLRTVKGKTGTSCPNVSEYLDAFEGAENVFAVTITSNLSGSCAAAIQAAAEYEETHEGAHAYVVDSLSTGGEMRLIMEHIRAQVLAGLNFEQIRDSVREYQKHTHLLFSLQSLANLARNGRVSPAVAKLAGVLGIRILGAASDEGTLQPLHKCRGEKKMLDTMVEEMLSRGFKGGKVRISHCLNPESAQELKERLLAKFPTADIFIEPCGALCSFYAERGGMIVGYEDSLA
ncbi:MAG: DegV family protein [Oscillospiraceae bacterium]|nr:DegV family protein [Oscillospiraceae bacterium]